MSPVFISLILLLVGHSIHDSSAARVRSSNLQWGQHVAEHDDDTGRNLSSTDNHTDAVRNLNSTNNRITIVSDRTDRDLLHTAPKSEEDVRHFVATTWHRFFKEASSMANIAVSRVGGTVFALYLYCASIALVLFVLTCLCVCSSGKSREGKSRKAASKSNGVKFPSNSGRNGQLQVPRLPIPETRSYHQCTTQPSQEQFTAQPSTFPFAAQQSQFAAQPARKVIDFGEVVARLSRTIKKVPTGHISYSVHRWVGIGPQERHFAVWWGAEAHTWPTARFGWWKSKQDHEQRKQPKGDLALKDVSAVRLIDHDGVSDPGVCITRADGVDDLLLFFQNPGVAEQYAKDLLSLVGKVKGSIRAESVIRKQQGKQQ